MIARQSAVSVWDGGALFRALTLAADVLTANQNGINALNVFPVRDGDTGTNMALTMRAALDEIANLDLASRASAGAVAERAAYGSLMGARGNSGVILSQIFRGLARGIGDLDQIDGRDVARALTCAGEMAYKAVMHPVEGTMLTVMRVAGDRAASAAVRDSSTDAVLGEALTAAREALADTPNQLDVLRQAGVVNAGGQGIVFLLDGLVRFAGGDDRPIEANDLDQPLGAAMAFLDQVTDAHQDDAFGYCTNFLISGTDIDFDAVRAALAEMGTSAVIVGDDRLVKVHIHVENPGRALDYALRHGELSQIKIDNMNAQVRALTEQRAVFTSALRPSAPAFDLEPIGKQAVLAVACGEGLAGALREMGATGIVPGGPTMNPSVEELLAAVESTSIDDVILLPNDANILLAAGHVPQLTGKRVRIVPTRSVPEALAALSVYNADADLETNVNAMNDALGAVRSVEVTRAVKDASIGGFTVARGQAIGLLDGRIVAAGDDVVDVAARAMALANLGAAELVTIFTGREADADCTERLETAVLALNPAIEIQVYAGGQPHHHFIISVE